MDIVQTLWYSLFEPPRCQKHIESKPEINYILITGASSGLGYETVVLLSKLGYHVVATYRHDIGMMKLANIPNVKVVHLDLSNQSSIDLFFKNIEGLNIRILINNAAEIRKKDMLHVNVTSPIYLTLQLMTNRKISVVNITDFCYFYDPDPTYKKYAYSKQLNKAFTKYINLNTSSKAVTFNPGFLNSNLYRCTPGIRKFKFLGTPPERAAKALSWVISELYHHDIVSSDDIVFDCFWKSSSCSKPEHDTYIALQVNFKSLI